MTFGEDYYVTNKTGSAALELESGLNCNLFLILLFLNNVSESHVLNI